MEKHVTLVAMLHIVFGFFGLFTAVILLIILVGAGILSGEPDALAITSIVGTAIALLLAVTSLPGIIGGFGLLKQKTWARVLIIIIACMNLLAVPFGTILGVYALWVLLSEETVRMFQ
jgi:hypothetical protein